MEAQKTGFTQDELMLNYTAWSKLAKERRNHLAPNVRKWLSKWEIWDLYCSPMDDNDRRNIRFGHYLCWFYNEEMTSNAAVSGRGGGQ